MLMNGFWVFIFQTGNQWGIMIAMFDQFAIVATDVYIMMRSTRTQVNIVEAFVLRIAFTLYSGWVTSASIINAAVVLKMFGLADPDIPFGLDEEKVTLGILYTAFVIYNTASFVELNPLYGGVFIWVGLAVRSLLLKEKPELTLLIENTEYITVA